jgi:hypothetical protein
MTYVERLSSWFEHHREGTLAGFDVNYRVAGVEHASRAHLFIVGDRRFVEVLLHDTGEAELAVGRSGEPGYGRYFKMEHPDEVAYLVEHVDEVVASWRAVVARTQGALCALAIAACTTDRF